ncbi:MAG: HAD family hydrolase [Proteobacteria bacterium]|nr:HAD family hydrolase [Pseudomonadota bacterium]
MTLRIAMWSGPRNISTAMMRVFENRPDCAVSDEPFYAHYLAATGIDHPMREAVMATQPTDWRQVVAAITGPAPGGAPLWYQKHMTHHMIPAVGRGWFDRALHAFLIRDPRAIAASYAAKREGTNAADLGAQLQAELYDAVVAATGREPPVIDADDVLADPERLLGLLCTALAVPFHPAMLSWPAGPRDSDGVWGEHWYASVRASTGFRAPPEQEIVLSPELEAVAAACMPFYERLHERRLGR